MSVSRRQAARKAFDRPAAVEGTGGVPARGREHYGPHTALALTLGAGTDIFTLDVARPRALRPYPRPGPRATAGPRVRDQRFQLLPAGTNLV
jgi:hypothetical protein